MDRRSFLGLVGLAIVNPKLPALEQKQKYDLLFDSAIGEDKTISFFYYRDDKGCWFRADKDHPPSMLSPNTDKFVPIDHGNGLLKVRRVTGKHIRQLPVRID